MRILFIQESGIDESPVLSELSTWMKLQGHDTALRFRRSERHFIRALDEVAPQMVILPASVLAFSWAQFLAREIRHAFADTPIVLAGSLPTLVPASLAAIPEADFALFGEIEYALPALCDAISQAQSLDNVPNLIQRSPDGIRVHPPASPFAELSELPLPDRAMYFERYPFMAQFPWKRMQASRGCVYSCSFCYQPFLRRAHGSARGFVRYKRPEQSVAEAVDLQRSGKTRHLHFGDDLFTCNVEWLETFAGLYRKEVGLPFTINTTADYVTDESARLLSEAGCTGIAIGIEAESDQVRTQALGKNIKNSAIALAADRIRRSGMQLLTFNLLAHESDTVNAAIDGIRFNAELGTDFARATICQPLPGLTGHPGETNFQVEDLPDFHTMFNKVHYQHLKAQEKAFVALYHAFPFAVAHPRFLPLVRRISRSRFAFLLHPLGFWRLFKEKAYYRLRWWEAFRYFLAVGHPRYRTNNFADLIA